MTVVEHCVLTGPPYSGCRPGSFLKTHHRGVATSVRAGLACPWPVVPASLFCVCTNVQHPGDGSLRLVDDPTPLSTTPACVWLLHGFHRPLTSPGRNTHSPTHHSHVRLARTWSFELVHHRSAWTVQGCTRSTGCPFPRLPPPQPLVTLCSVSPRPAPQPCPCHRCLGSPAGVRPAGPAASEAGLDLGTRAHPAVPPAADLHPPAHPGPAGQPACRGHVEGTRGAGPHVQHDTTHLQGGRPPGDQHVRTEAPTCLVSSSGSAAARISDGLAWAIAPWVLDRQWHLDRALLGCVTCDGKSCKSISAPRHLVERRARCYRSLCPPGDCMF